MSDTSGCLTIQVVQDCSDTPGAACSQAILARCNGEQLRVHCSAGVDTESVVQPTGEVVMAVDSKPIVDIDRVYLRVVQILMFSPKR